MEMASDFIQVLLSESTAGLDSTFCSVVTLSNTRGRLCESPSRRSLIEALAKIAVIPYNLHVPRKPEVVFRKKDDEQPVPFADKVPVARRVYMKPEDFTTFG